MNNINLRDELDILKRKYNDVYSELLEKEREASYLKILLNNSTFGEKFFLKIKSMWLYIPNPIRQCIKKILKIIYKIVSLFF